MIRNKVYGPPALVLAASLLLTGGAVRADLEGGGGGESYTPPPEETVDTGLVDPGAPGLSPEGGESIGDALEYRGADEKLDGVWNGIKSMLGTDE